MTFYRRRQLQTPLDSIMDDQIIEDQRALQLAMSMLGLNADSVTPTNSSARIGSPLSPCPSYSIFNNQGFSTNSPTSPFEHHQACKGLCRHSSILCTSSPDDIFRPSCIFEPFAPKKSQNMTECVPVPSSEHVAEIVGRQGKLIIYGLLNQST